MLRIMTCNWPTSCPLSSRGDASTRDNITEKQPTFFSTEPILAADEEGLAPLRDYWTPTIVQVGALFVAIFQVAYLLHDIHAPREALYLHLANIGIALSGFVASLLPFGRTHSRSISF